MDQAQVSKLKTQCKIHLICNTDEVTVLYIKLALTLLGEIEKLLKQVKESS